jgi:hypothetical protein
VVLSSVEWRILKNDLLLIITTMDKAVPGSFQVVDCGALNRKKPAAEGSGISAKFQAKQLCWNRDASNLAAVVFNCWGSIRPDLAICRLHSV